MSENQQKQDPVEQTPSKAPVRKKSPSARKRRGRRRQDLIGGIVLGIGICAVIGVGLLAVRTFMPEPEQPLAQETQTGSQDDLTRSLELDIGKERDSGNAERKMPPGRDLGKRKEDDPRLNVPRGRIFYDPKLVMRLPDFIAYPPKVPVEKIVGVWQTNLPRGRAFLTVNPPYYQIIMVSRGAYSYSRKYVRGVFEISADWLLLEPRSTLGRPKSDNPVMSYETLGTISHPVVLKMHKDRMLWFKGPKIEGKGSERTYYQPLFNYIDKDVIVWERFQR